MRFSDSFKLSTRMFKARTSRTLLTILGMSVGIAAILFLVSLGYGLQKTLLKKITTSDALLTLDVSEAKSSSVILDEKTVKEISEIEGVQEVSPAFQLGAEGRLDDLSAKLTAVVIKPSFLKLGGLPVNYGQPLSDENPRDIVVTSTVAQTFGKSNDEIIGEDIKFSFFVPQNESPSELKQVEDEKIYKISGVAESDDNFIYINAISAENIFFNRYSQLKVKCETNEIMESVRDQIAGKEFLVSSLSDTVKQANQVFRAIQIILMLFGVVALIISAIGMFNTMTIALLERTEEIGIMKSIGASNLGISLMFIMESAIMGFLGGLGGVVIGFAGGEIFNSLVNFVARRFGGEPVDLFSIPPWFVGIIILFAGVVGIATGFIPARKASRIDPLEALRYK